MPSPSILRHRKTWLACLLARWRGGDCLSGCFRSLTRRQRVITPAGMERWRQRDMESWRGGDMERTEGRTKNNGANSDKPMLIFLSVYSMSMSMAEIVTKQGNIAQAWKWIYDNHKTRYRSLAAKSMAEKEDFKARTPENVWLLALVHGMDSVTCGGGGVI